MNSLPPKRNIQLSAIVSKEALVIKKKYFANTTEEKQKKNVEQQAKSLDVKNKN